MYRSRGFRFMGIILGLALVATACGGSDATPDDATTTVESSSDDESTTAASSTTTTAAEPLSGDSGSEYCDKVREAEASDQSPLDFSFFGSTPEEIETQFEKNLEIFAEWPAVAPDEIKDDAELIFDFYEQFVERGNALNWNLDAMADDEAFNTTFDNPDLDAATVNVENYTRDVCGVDLTQSGTPPVGDSADPLGDLLTDLGIPIPTNILSEENLECLTTALEPLLDAGIGEGYVPTAEDLALFSEAIDTCGIG
jgi:hypothetical protein